MDEYFFKELVTILGMSLVGALLFSRLRVPTIVAYMFVGALIGPYALGFVQSPASFSFLAEFGVVFLLFSLGLEFSVSRLLSMRFMVFGVGALQVAACFLVFAGSVRAWGADINTSIVIAGALALSSTAIVTRELHAHREVGNRYARLSIGVLLFQDLVAVVFLILVPVLAASQQASLGEELLGALVRGGILLLVLISVGRWVLPAIYREVAKARSQEIFVLATLVIGLLASWLTHELRLSMALGGFIIGMMLGESDFRHQVETDLRPFKDILLGLFFVTLGMSIDVSLLLEYWPRLIVFTLALVLLKLVVVFAVVRMVGERPVTALQTGITLAQAGEFGLALLALASAEGLLQPDVSSFVIMLALFTMALSALMIRRNTEISEWILERLGSSRGFLSQPGVEADIPAAGHVIVGGFGRVGQTLVALLRDNQVPHVVIENDASRVRDARRAGEKVVFGDCNRIEMLESVNIADARLAVLTFGSIDVAKTTLQQIRARYRDVPVILRCYEEGELQELVSLGANHVVPEMLETRLLIASQVLGLLGLPEEKIERQISRLRHASVPADPG